MQLSIEVCIGPLDKAEADREEKEGERKVEGKEIEGKREWVTIKHQNKDYTEKLFTAVTHYLLEV